MCRVRHGGVCVDGSHRGAGCHWARPPPHGVAVVLCVAVLFLHIDLLQKGLARGCGCGVVNTPRPAAHAVLCWPRAEQRMLILFMYSNRVYMLAALLL